MKALKQNFSVFFIMLILFFSLGGNFFLFSQEKTGNLSGIVEDDEGNPIPGVTIEAWSPQAKKAFTQSTVTNKTGHFKLSNIPTGAYEITFSLPGFLTLKKEIMFKSGITRDLMIRMRIRATEEDVTFIDASPVIDQEKTGNLSGIVADEEGNPLPGVSIVMSNTQAKPIHTHITTSKPTGHFLFSNLPAEAYTITFTLRGFKPVTKEKIEVQSDQTLHLSVTMEIDPPITQIP
jgi:5-hydroxyisourate hydrolase-like protein (transthyretin family)